MSLFAQISAPEPSDNRRDSARRCLRLEVPGTPPSGEAGNVLIHNISATGVLLETAEILSLGERLTVELPHAGSTVAEVIWSSGGRYGCRFEEPLSPGALSAAQLLNPPQGDAEPAADKAANGDESLGQRMRRLRRERGMSVPQLARSLGLSKPTIWNWEAGKSRPRLGRVAAVAQALGVSEPELLHGIGPAAAGQSPDGAESGRAGASERFGEPVPTATRLSELIVASKAQIAALAGTTPDKVRIIVEL